MTKRVRIENADGSPFKVVVQVWDKAVTTTDGIPQSDTLVKEIPLDFPTAMTSDECYITSTRYLVVKEV